MNIISVGCQLRYEITTPATFLFNIAAARTPHQNLLSEAFCLTPDTPYEECGTGSEINRIFRLSVQPGELYVTYEATVELQPVVENPPQVQETQLPALPPEVLPYVNPSRYCESDRLIRLVNQEFGELLPGYSRVMAICNWTYEHLQYQAGCSDAHTTACDVLVQRAGVCRDYAHLAIALCRALCIPARYVSGYAVELYPPDFHGFFEAYLGNRWYLFDATRMAPVNGFVRIGSGRDAADAAFATVFGLVQMQEMSVWAKDNTPEPAAGKSPPDAAISTA